MHFGYNTDGGLRMKICHKEDTDRLMSYLKINAPMNLFFIGDIENFGFDSDFQTVYMDEDEEGIHAVYLVYRTNLCMMSYEQKVDQAFADSLVEKYKIKCINAEESLMKKYSFPLYTDAEDCFFAKMEKENMMCDTSLVERLKEEDAKEIAELEDAVFHSKMTVEEIQTNFRTHAARSYGIKADGKLVSVASSTAECSSLAMIVGVCTYADYRDRHYASACITKLANDLIHEGKMLCLFYNKPNAARIYKALGFADIGRWSMRKKEQ